MPYADPEKQRQANKEAAKRSRAKKAGKGATPPKQEPGQVASLGLAPLVSAKDLNLDALTDNIKAETDNLSQDGWLNLQGALGLEIWGIVRSALRSTLQVRTVKDLVALTKLAQMLIAPVIESRGKLGGDETIPSDLQEAHKRMLLLPGGIENANQMVQLLSQALLMGPGAGA